MDTNVVATLIGSGSVKAGSQYVNGVLPEGFEKLASGCTRTAIRCGDVVIKVGDALVNSTEVERTKYMRNDPNLPDWCYIPEAELVNGVVVQEFVPNVATLPDCEGYCRCGWDVCWADRAMTLMRDYDLVDLHCENCTVRWEGDDYVLIVFDLGCGFGC